MLVTCVLRQEAVDIDAGPGAIESKGLHAETAIMRRTLMIRRLIGRQKRAIRVHIHYHPAQTEFRPTSPRLDYS